LSRDSSGFVRGLTAREPSSEGREAGAHDFKLESFVPRGKKHEFKHDQEMLGNFTPGNIARSREGARELLAEALEKARQEAESIKRQAEENGRAAGHAEGLAEGERAAREQFQPLVESFEKVTRELAAYRKQMYGRVEREMVEMVVALAKKVIRYEMATREESIQDMIRLAVQSVLDKEFMTIKINPEDKEHAENFRPELTHLYPEIQKIVIEPQSGIARGGCVIETNFGAVDARIEKLEEGLDKILQLAPRDGEHPA